MEMEDGVPCGLENFPARLLNQYYPHSESTSSYDLLPLYGNDWYNYKVQRQYSLLDNECLNEKWKKFVCDPSMEKSLVFPTARGNRFINQVACYKPPNEIHGYCRAPMSLLPGPLVDEYGALPIPADYDERYRKRWRPEPKKKIEKKVTVKATEPPPPPPPPTPPVVPPPPPRCICPPLPFYCCCPAEAACKSLLQSTLPLLKPCLGNTNLPTPPQSNPCLPPTPPQVQNAVCTPCKPVCSPPQTTCGCD